MYHMYMTLYYIYIYIYPHTRALSFPGLISVARVNWYIHVYNWYIHVYIWYIHANHAKSGDTEPDKLFDCNSPKDERGVLLDISMAFKKAWHEGLIFKLKT